MEDKIEVLNSGTIVISGPVHTELVRLLTLRAALKLEIKGIRLSRGRSASQIARQLFVHPPRAKEKVLAALESYIELYCRQHGLKQPSWVER